MSSRNEKSVADFQYTLRDVYLQNNGQDETTVCGMFFGLEFLQPRELDS